MSRHVVSFHYTLRDPSGQVLDMSTGGEPVSYLEGAGQIIDGLDEQLHGVAAGTKKRVSVPAQRAYGLPDPAMIHKIPRSQIPFEGELKIGDRFQTEPDPGAPVVTIAAVEGDDVTLDANHPLAGVDLTFDVEIVAVRAATEEELSHGHAHAGDGHGHGEGGCGCGGDAQCSSDK